MDKQEKQTSNKQEKQTINKFPLKNKLAESTNQTLAIYLYCGGSLVFTLLYAFTPCQPNCQTHSNPIAYFQVPHGGWFSICMALVLCSLMYVWHWGSATKGQYSKHHKATLDQIIRVRPGSDMRPNFGDADFDPTSQVEIELIDSGHLISRVPGIGLFYSDGVWGVPAVFTHYIHNMPAIHEVSNALNRPCLISLM